MKNLFIAGDAVTRLPNNDDGIDVPDDIDSSNEQDLQKSVEEIVPLKSLTISKNKAEKSISRRRVIEIVEPGVANLDDESDLNSIVNTVAELFKAIQEDISAKKKDDYNPVNFKPKILRYNRRLRNIGIITPVFSEKVDYKTKVKEIAKVVQKYLLDNEIDIDVRDENGKTLLEKACSERSIKRLNLLLLLGSTVNLPDSSGDTPLQNACKNQHSDTIKLLLNRKANPNVEDQNGSTPLFLAIEAMLRASKLNIFIVRSLLKKGAKLTISNDQGVNLWSLLVQNGRFDNTKGYDSTVGKIYEIADLLLENGADINAVVEKHGVKTTFLIEVAKKNIFKLPEFVNRGANLYAQDSVGESALSLIFKYKHIKKISKGKRDDLIKSLNIDFEKYKPTRDGDTLLHLFTKHNFYDIKLLLKKNIGVDKKNLLGETPLHIACKAADKYTFEYIIDAVEDVNVLDANGNTPLLLAIKNEIIDYGRFSMTYALLGKDANPNIMNSNGETPLSILLKYVNLLRTFDYTEFAKQLFLHGVDINQLVRMENGSYKTFIMLIIEKGNPIEIMHFINMGADLNISNNDGVTAASMISKKWSPLHLACLNGDVSEVNRLLIEGFDVNCVRTFGTILITPITLALHCFTLKQDYDASIIKLLLEKGAKIKADELKGNMDYRDYCSLSNSRNEPFNILKSSKNYANPDLYKVAHLLVSKGADINCSDVPNYLTETFIVKVAKAKQFDRIKECIDLGANPYVTDSDGNSALALMLMDDYPGSLSIFENLELDFSKVQENRKGINLFHIAANNKNLKVIEFLLKGFDINFVNKAGKPLWTRIVDSILTLDKNGFEVVKSLIPKIANINQRCLKTGKTMLMEFVKNKRQIHRLFDFLKLGADLYMPDNNGNSAFSRIVCGANDSRYIDVLEKLDIDPAKINPDHNGDGPLHIAAINDNFHVMNILIRKGLKLFDKNIYRETVFDIALGKYYSEQYEAIFNILNLYFKRDNGIFSSIFAVADSYRECKELMVERSLTILQHIRAEKNPLEVALVLNDPRIGRAFVANLGSKRSQKFLAELPSEVALSFIESITFDLNEAHLAHKVETVPTQPKEEEYQIEVLTEMFDELTGYNEVTELTPVLENKLGKFVIDKASCKALSTTIKDLRIRLDRFINSCKNRSEYSGVDKSERVVFWTNIERAVTNTLKVVKNFDGTDESIYSMKARLVCEYLHITINCGTRLDIEFDKVYFLNKSESDAFSLTSLAARRPISQIRIDESQIVTAELANQVSLERVRQHFNINSKLPSLSDGENGMIAEEHIFAILYYKLIHEDKRTDIVILPFGPGNIPPKELSKLSPEVKFVIAPCSVLDNKHNTVLVIDREKEEYFYFDSKLLTTSQEFENIIANFMQAGYISHDFKFNPIKGTYQGDDWSCGFHVVENAVRTVNAMNIQSNVQGINLRRTYADNFNNFVKSFGYSVGDVQVKSFSDFIYQKLSDLRGDVLESLAPRTDNSVHFIQAMLKKLTKYNIPIRKNIDPFLYELVIVDVETSFKRKYQENIFIYIKNILKSDSEVRSLFFDWLKENGRIVKEGSLPSEEIRLFFEYIEKYESLPVQATAFQKHLFAVFKIMPYSAKELRDEDVQKEIVGAFLTPDFWMMDEFEKIKASKEDVFEDLDPLLQQSITESGMRDNLAVFKTGKQKEIQQAKRRLFEKYTEINSLGKQVNDEDVYFLLQKFGVLTYIALD